MRRDLAPICAAGPSPGDGFADDSGQLLDRVGLVKKFEAVSLVVREHLTVTTCQYHGNVGVVDPDELA